MTKNFESPRLSVDEERALNKALMSTAFHRRGDLSHLERQLEERGYYPSGPEVSQEQGYSQIDLLEIQTVVNVFGDMDHRDSSAEATHSDALAVDSSILPSDSKAVISGILAATHETRSCSIRFPFSPQRSYYDENDSDDANTHSTRYIEVEATAQDFIAFCDILPNGCFSDPEPGSQRRAWPEYIHELRAAVRKGLKETDDVEGGDISCKMSAYHPGGISSEEESEKEGGMEIFQVSRIDPLTYVAFQRFESPTNLPDGEEEPQRMATDYWSLYKVSEEALRMKLDELRAREEEATGSVPQAGGQRRSDATDGSSEGSDKLSSYAEEYLVDSDQA